jgi:uncharacterized protein with PhoU and TrkA domain
MREHGRSLALDERLAGELARVLDTATLEDFGRALARKVDRLCAACDDAVKAVDEGAGLLQIAGAAATARYMADSANDAAQAVVALVGNGDSALTTHCLNAAKKAEREAARVERRWAVMKKRHGGAA